MPALQVDPYCTAVAASVVLFRTTDLMLCLPAWNLLGGSLGPPVNGIPAEGFRVGERRAEWKACANGTEPLAARRTQRQLPVSSGQSSRLPGLRGFGLEK